LLSISHGPHVTRDYSIHATTSHLAASVSSGSTSRATRRPRFSIPPR